jgi:cation:H+ antiporter
VVAQIGFVLGVGGLISILTLPRDFVFKHGAVLLGVTALLFLVALDGHVTRLEGGVLIAVYVIYVLALMNGGNRPDETPEPVAEGGWKSWLALIAGLIIVIVSSEVTVSSVVHLAIKFNISEALIAVLIIGLGTSLPELSISISALMKKRHHLSVGNIIGSNILDTVLPIGFAALIAGVNFEPGLLRFDLPYVFLMTLIILSLFLRKNGVQKPQALIILSLYLAYVLIKLSQF